MVNECAFSVAGIWLMRSVRDAGKISGCPPVLWSCVSTYG